MIRLFSLIVGFLMLVATIALVVTQPHNGELAMAAVPMAVFGGLLVYLALR